MVLVHSSLSSFGHVVGGAAAVVDALLDVVSPEGTVMVPTFTHNPFILFDPRTTASVSGAVTNEFWRRSQALRSLHPTHAYTAIGRQAEWLVSGHHEATTFGPASPLGKFCRAGGDVILMGVGINRATAMHLGEMLAGAACLGERTIPCRCIDPGTNKELTVYVDAFRSSICPAGDADEITRRLQQKGLWHEVMIGQARVARIKGWDIVEAYRLLLTEGWKGHPGCRLCEVQPHTFDSLYRRRHPER
jgi:aminoglycoside 3-N-acetyltransferase